MSAARYEELRDRLSELWDLAKLGALAGWDQQTMMPPQGAAVRARQFATISKVRFTGSNCGYCFASCS